MKNGCFLIRIRDEFNHDSNTALTYSFSDQFNLSS